MSNLEVRITTLYPELMNIYADRGNLVTLEQRCRWRDIDLHIEPASFGESIEPDSQDLIYIGGGQDRDQRRVTGDMVATKRTGLAAATEAGVVVLAVCGGFQLLGHSYRIGEEMIEGLGLVDMETVREPGPRLVGNIAIEADTGEGRRIIAGFENHGGRTYLGADEVPLGRVIAGFGNNGKDGTEGVRSRNIFGTYLHGPLLPKNVWLADHLIALALERQTGERPTLLPLDDSLESAAHEAAYRIALSDGCRLGGWRMMVRRLAGLRRRQGP